MFEQERIPRNGWNIRPRSKFDDQIAISGSEFLTVLQ